MIRCVASRGGNSAKLLAATSRKYISATRPSTPNDLELEYGISESDDRSSCEVSHTLREWTSTSAEKVDERSTEQRVECGLQEPPVSVAQHAERRDLPISPYMDPEYISAKEKYHARKLPPSKNPTSLQKLLAKNPYAIALATPVRTCRVTSVVLPRYFLQDFNLIAHPETKEPWWVPGSLARKYSPHQWSKDGDSPESILEPDELENKEIRSGKEPDTKEFKTAEDTIPSKAGSGIGHSSEGRPLSTRPIGPCSYVLSRQPLIAQFSRGGYLSKGQQLGTVFGVRLRDQKALQRLVGNARIRHDIDAFMLELLRRRVVEGLEYLVQLGSYVRPCFGWKDATMPSRQPGAILWVGPVLGQGQVDASNELQTRGPPEFATVDIRTVNKQKIPVYNLEVLLGRDHLQALREKSSIFERELLIIKYKKRAVDIHLLLWKLQGYVGKHAQFLDNTSSEETP
jgi:hypothetical protein